MSEDTKYPEEVRADAMDAQLRRTASGFIILCCGCGVDTNKEPHREDCFVELIRAEMDKGGVYGHFC